MPNSLQHSVFIRRLAGSMPSAPAIESPSPSSLRPFTSNLLHVSYLFMEVSA